MSSSLTGRLVISLWSDGREAEGAGLLNLYTRKGIEGSNPSRSAHGVVETKAPLAQLDRALDYESKGRRFESSRERSTNFNFR